MTDEERLGRDLLMAFRGLLGANGEHEAALATEAYNRVNTALAGKMTVEDFVEALK